jgi:DNA-binding MarR family transcriptional regulator
MVIREDPLELAARTRRAVGRLSRSLRRTQAGADLSPSQYEVLVTIVGNESVRLAELSLLEGLNPTMLSRITAKLETSGLVERTTGVDDGRVVSLSATEHGRELITRIRRERADVLSVALDDLTDAQRQALVAALPVLEELTARMKDRPQ